VAVRAKASWKRLSSAGTPSRPRSMRHKPLRGPELELIPSQSLIRVGRHPYTTGSLDLRGCEPFTPGVKALSLMKHCSVCDISLHPGGARSFRCGSFGRKSASSIDRNSEGRGLKVSRQARGAGLSDFFRPRVVLRPSLSLTVAL
jgi:hypothetical protein